MDTAIDMREVVNSTKLPTCALPGHQLKELVFVCLDINCSKCQARDSKLLCSKCILTEPHGGNMNDTRDFIIESGSYKNIEDSIDDYFYKKEGKPAETDPGSDLQGDLLNIVEEYRSYLTNYRLQCNSIVDR